MGAARLWQLQHRAAILFETLSSSGCLPGIRVAGACFVKSRQQPASHNWFLGKREDSLYLSEQMILKCPVHFVFDQTQRILQTGAFGYLPEDSGNTEEGWVGSNLGSLRFLM